MLHEWTVSGWMQVALIALSTLVMYATVITLTRLAGVRSFSKMSGFDFAVTVAIGSVLGSVILSKDPPLANGVAALVCLFGLQIGMAVFRSRFSGLQTLSDNKPRLIMIGTEIQHDQLKKAKMTTHDLWGKLWGGQYIAVFTDSRGCCRNNGGCLGFACRRRRPFDSTGIVGRRDRW